MELKQAISFYIVFLVMSNFLQKISLVNINFCMCTMYENVLEFFLTAYLHANPKIP